MAHGRSDMPAVSCLLCNTTVGRRDHRCSGVREHALSCAITKLSARITAADPKPQPVLHLRIGALRDQFLVEVLAREDATLADLHVLLRKTWFQGAEGDCQFYVLPQRRPFDPTSYVPVEIDAGLKVGSEFVSLGDKRQYIFDLFNHGQATKCDITLVQRGYLTPKASALMGDAPLAVIMRTQHPGHAPAFACTKCKQPSRYQRYSSQVGGPYWHPWRQFYCSRACVEADGLPWAVHSTNPDTQADTFLFRMWDSPRSGQGNYDGPDDITPAGFFPDGCPPATPEAPTAPQELVQAAFAKQGGQRATVHVQAYASNVMTV